MADGAATAPWSYHWHPVGGLWAVGFAPATDLLLVLSANGRGVFDCLTGQRLARDLDDGDYDETSETAVGIGPLIGARIPLCGTGGGVVTERTLPLVSADGWTVAVLRSTGVELQPPSSREATRVVDVEEVRALGFSSTARSFVVAEPHTLHVWHR